MNYDRIRRQFLVDWSGFAPEWLFVFSFISQSLERWDCKGERERGTRWIWRWLKIKSLMFLDGRLAKLTKTSCNNSCSSRSITLQCKRRGLLLLVGLSPGHSHSTTIAFLLPRSLCIPFAWLARFIRSLRLRSSWDYVSSQRSCRKLRKIIRLSCDSLYSSSPLLLIKVFTTSLWVEKAFSIDGKVSPFIFSRKNFRNKLSHQNCDRESRVPKWFSAWR